MTIFGLRLWASVRFAFLILLILLVFVSIAASNLVVPLATLRVLVTIAYIPSLGWAAMVDGGDIAVGCSRFVRPDSSIFAISAASFTVLLIDMIDLSPIAV